MNKEQSVQRFVELLQALGRRNSLRDPMAAALEAEFTGPQLHAIMWLGADGALTMGELAHRIGATEKTITGIVDRLEREGYVRRERDEADRRVVRVDLTRKGRSSWQTIDAEVREKLAGFLSLLDDKDRSDLFRILEHVLQRVDALASAQPSNGRPPAL